MYFLGQAIFDTGLGEKVIFLGTDANNDFKVIDSFLRVHTLTGLRVNDLEELTRNGGSRVIYGPFVLNEKKGLWHPNSTQQWKIKKYLTRP